VNAVDGVMLLAGVLATWRIMHLVVQEDGPWNLVAHLRRLAGAGPLGRMMDCFYCASLWAALPLALALDGGWGTRIVAWLAWSGGAMLLQRLLPQPPPA
jgi:hypothetical protein